VGQHPQPIVLKVSKTIGPPGDHFHLVVEALCDAIGSFVGLSIPSALNASAAAIMALAFAGEMFLLGVAPSDIMVGMFIPLIPSRIDYDL
jgi:hypothetical protein